MMRVVLIFGLAIFGLLTSCSNSQEKVSREIENPTNKVVLYSEIAWEKLNPARGDKSPQAGTIWGDRRGTVATGFLAKFVDGFSSPPHIHNVTYRAVVIKGLVHNSDPNAENMWMTPGSFWTQPVGESHITSAKGEENIAYVEIDKGPYLVKPVAEAFDSEEQPINMDASNVIWLNSEKTNWISSNSKAELSFLWESKRNNGLKGLFVKLPKGFDGEIFTSGKIMHAIVVKGQLDYKMPLSDEVKNLEPGSYFNATDKAIHEITTTEEAVLYIRTDGVLEIDEPK